MRLLSNLLLCAGLHLAACDATDTVPTAEPPAGVWMEGGALNTNYRAGTGFVVGGTDPAPPDPLETTDAANKTYPNSRTDVVTATPDDDRVQQLLQAARQYLGTETALRFYAPTDGVLARLQRPAGRTVQFIVNQYYTRAGGHLLVTWALPPDWDPSRPHALMLYAPGFLNTNNSQMLQEPADGFVPAYFRAVAAAAQGNVLFMHVNVGGRTATGFQPGLADIVHDALLWGEANLGLDRSRIVIGGASRGGYASYTLGTALHQRPGNFVRGIFARVFGNASFEYQPPRAELVPSDIEEKTTLGWDEFRRRLFGAPSLAHLDDVGPRGATTALVNAAATKGPVDLYLAFGSADPTMLMASVQDYRNRLAAQPGIRAEFRVSVGGGHEAARLDRNSRMAQFASALANGQSPAVQPGLYLVEDPGGRTLHQQSAMVPHLRMPARVAYALTTGETARTAAFEVVGPAGMAYQVQLVRGDDTRSYGGTLPAQGWAVVPFPVPAEAGDWQVRWSVDGTPAGTLILPVVALANPADMSGPDWRPNRMPVLYRWP